MLSDCGLVVFLFHVCFSCQVTSVVYTDIRPLASYQLDFKDYVTPQDWPARVLQQTSRPVG